MIFDSIIIGGGIAGLQAAIQLGRYKHRVLVIDAGEGRSALCRSYRNILGYPEGVSGEWLRQTGREQARRLGVEFVSGWVDRVERTGEQFAAYTRRNPDQPYRAGTLLLATGVMDRFPDLPGLVPCLGASVYICPDCDGYEVSGKRTVVMGSGNVGARMAITLTYWTGDIVYVNHEGEAIADNIMRELEKRGIPVIAKPIVRVETGKEGVISGVRLSDGTTVSAESGFLAFGGNEVRTDLAKQLGVERAENMHILADPRTKATNIPRVWAAGDIGVHSEQVTIALGDGAQAAIWMHKSIMELRAKSPSTVT